jgi:hypothetical protein
VWYLDSTRFVELICIQMHAHYGDMWHIRRQMSGCAVVVLITGLYNMRNKRVYNCMRILIYRYTNTCNTLGLRSSSRVTAVQSDNAGCNYHFNCNYHFTNIITPYPVHLVILVVVAIFALGFKDWTDDVHGALSVQ